MVCKEIWNIILSQKKVVSILFLKKHYDGAHYKQINRYKQTQTT